MYIQIAYTDFFGPTFLSSTMIGTFALCKMIKVMFLYEGPGNIYESDLVDYLIKRRCD